MIDEEAAMDGSRLPIAFCVALSFLGGPLLQAADSVRMKEDATDGKVFKVTVTMQLSGQLQVPGKLGQLQPTNLAGNAKFQYLERRLPGTGRDAESFRTVRHYEQAQAEIKTGDYKMVRGLAENRRLIVAEGRREGVRQFSPYGPLTYEELDLVQFPADTVSLWGLLPDRAVEPGETWKPADWVLQLMTGVEAVEKTSLICKLDQVTNGIARVTVAGNIRGADLGARCQLAVKGHYTFNVTDGYLSRIELTQEDKREAGVLHPPFNITAKVIVTREPAEEPRLVTEQALQGVPLETTPGSLLLMFESADLGLRFYHDRQWHSFHQTPTMAILRMMSQGNLVAQCQVHTITPRAAPGEHLAEDKFKADIKKSMAGNFQEFIRSDTLTGPGGMYHYQVAVLGKVERPVEVPEDPAKKPADPKKLEPRPMVAAEIVPFHWIYNLFAAADGRQAVFTFIVEATQTKAFAAQDATLTSSLEFLRTK